MSVRLALGLVAAASCPRSMARWQRTAARATARAMRVRADPTAARHVVAQHGIAAGGGGLPTNPERQQAGDVLFPRLQSALATAGRDGLAAYPVRANLTGAAGAPYTGVVAQYRSDGILDGHYIFTQLDAVQYQCVCFFDSLLNGGTAVVPAPAPLGTPCPR